MIYVRIKWRWLLSSRNDPSDQMSYDKGNRACLSTSEFLMTNHNKQDFKHVNTSLHCSTSGDLKRDRSKGKVFKKNEM